MNIDKEELTELIRDIITEERAESIAHPTRRERVTRFTDPEGKTWVSMTLERGEIVTKLAALLVALTTIFSIANYFVSRLVVYPAIEERVTAEIKNHEEQVRTRMNEVAPTLVTRTEWKEWTAEKNERWRNQDEFNRQVGNAIIEMQKDIKLLLQRQGR